MKSLEEIFHIVNTAIDDAFTREKYQLNFFEYLKGENYKRDTVIKFINSNLSVAILNQIEELDIYIEGGPSASLFREAYSWMGKPRARKIREYLNAILEDAKKYEQSKKPGRKPGSKNKKKAETTNK